VKLDRGQVEAIADYLLSLQPVEAGTDQPDAGDGDAGGGDPVATGQAAFATNCAACHSTGSDTVVGPGLAGIGERAATRVDGLGPDEYIRQSIRESTAYVVPGFGPSMPSFPQLSEEEIAGLVAYLKTLN